MTFSQELKKLMIQNEMTQKQLSDLTGLAKSSISQYVSGKNEPSAENKKRLMKVLEVDADFLEESESQPESTNNISISFAAKKLGKSEQFVRVGLQNGILPFGFAVKMSSKFTYHISPKKFKEYVG
ncbi:helix-turn-helix transcriptional regulator [Mycobacteroides abscessus]|uniref:helix-turn-helix domain-containing protein n=1 Tax=unclassified Desemzia TaxID=2685243 RepID=UPI0013FCFE71